MPLGFSLSRQHGRDTPFSRWQWLSLLCLAAVAGGTACDSAADAKVLAESSGIRAEAGIDTLRSEAATIVAEPVWVTTDPDGRYVIVDRSDRNIKIFNRDGTLHSVVGGPGTGAGEFSTLFGGGVLGDSIVGYDFATARLSVFDRQGRFARSMLLASPGRSLPLTVQPVGDSLLLGLGVPAGNHTRDLLTLLDLQGRVRGQFFNRSEYFTSNAPDLVQSSIVVAAGGHGIVAASLLGADSLWVFDYSGRPIASGAVAIEGQRIASAAELRTRNGGSMRTAGGASVLAGQPLLTSLAVLSPTTVMMQVMTFDFGKQPRLDRTVGGRYLLAEIDPERRTVEIITEADRIGGLLGQTSLGAAIVLRYIDEEYRKLEIERLTTLGHYPSSGG